MKILHTDYDARHPWPEGLLVQGGKSGLVIRPVEQGGNYGTAFVECFPAGTFLRGEGPVLAEAEDACWARYQRFLTCAGDGEHGPFEPREYENGSGFCVRCGTWFSRVCAPSVDYEIAETACNRVTSRFGPDIVVMPQWRGLVADEKARIWAAMRGEAEPVATTVPPTPEELAESMDQPLAAMRDDMTERIAHMHPATRGVSRPLWGHTAEYIGGPFDGQRSPTGWHGLRRDENGSSLRLGKAMPPHYVLYCCNGVYDWYYVHTSLVS